MDRALSSLDVQKPRNLAKFCFMLFAGFYFALAALWLSLAAHHLEPGRQVALIYPPGWSAQETFVAALKLKADMLTLGRTDFIVIVTVKDSTTLSDLRASGALLVLNAAGAAICAPQ